MPFLTFSCYSVILTCLYFCAILIACNVIMQSLSCSPFLSIPCLCSNSAYAASIGLPPLLVQRCNGTTAGLGYLDVQYTWFVHSNLPIGRLTSVRTVNLHWGEWLNSSAYFNPNNNHVNSAPTQASLQTTSRPHHHATPMQNYCIQMYSSQYLSVK